MSLVSTTTATSTCQERTPLPTFNLIPVDDETLDEIDRIAKEKVQMGWSKSSSLEERVSPRSEKDALTNHENAEDFSWDNDTNCNFPILTESLSNSGNFSASGLSSSGYQSSTDSLSSSNFFTPPHTPEKKKPMNSPQALKTLKNVMENNDPSNDIISKDSGEVDAALKTLSQRGSPDKSKNVARQLFKEVIEKTGTVKEVPSPEVVGRRLIFATNDYESVMGNWTISVAKELRFSFIDERHLIDLERLGGFHICGPNHPRDRFVTKRRTNIWTDVWCGQVCKEGDLNNILKQFTSFVPRDMSLAHYNSLISNAINTPSFKIAEQNNRRLYKLIDEKHNLFVVELYFQEQYTRIKSAIPIFHYEVYNKIDTSFRVVYLCQETVDDNVCIADYDVSYEKLFKLLKTCNEAIVYDTEDKIIVDVGLLFSTPNQDYDVCPIEKGVLVEIPKAFLI